MSNEGLHPEKGLVRSDNPNVWVTLGFASKVKTIPTTDLRDVYAAVIDNAGAEKLRQVLTPSNWRQRANERLNALVTTCASKFIHISDETPVGSGLRIASISTALSVVAMGSSLLPQPESTAGLIALGEFITLFIGSYKLHQVCSRFVQCSAAEKIIPPANQ